MSELSARVDEEISLFSVTAALLRRRTFIAGFALAAAVLAAIVAFRRLPQYEATASFVPLGSESTRSGLSSLAGQLGLSLPSGGQALGPDFYLQLLRSRVIIDSVAQASFVVPEVSPNPKPLADLLKVPGRSIERQQEASKVVATLVTASLDTKTGIIKVAIKTPWRSLSLAMLDSLLQKVDEFNQQTRRDQAAAERKFVEGQLASAAANLRAAEDRLQQFLAGNRQCCAAPELAFQRDRIQRDVTLKDQLYTSLNQAYQDVRLKEVRDTPVISIIEPPFAPVLALPRGRIKTVILGAIVGGVLAALLVLVGVIVRRLRQSNDPELADLTEALSEVRGSIRRPLYALSRRNS